MHPRLRWTNHLTKYVLSSRVRTGRSIRGYALPPWCTRAERRQVEKLSCEALSKLDGELKGKYYSLTTMTDTPIQVQIEPLSAISKSVRKCLPNSGRSRKSPPAISK